MNSKKSLWLIIGIIVLGAALVSGFVLMQPSVEDILVETFETAKGIESGHAVIAFDLDSVEKDASGTVEVWARHDEEGAGAFRLEVLETNEEKAQGAIIVSDGETLWAYSPTENKVFVGTPEEAQAMMAEGDFMDGEYAEGHADTSDGEMEHPETPEEAVQELLTYFNIGKSQGDGMLGENTYLLKLDPIAEEMPPEFAAAGGFINLWIGRESKLPLAMAYTGGSFGEFNGQFIDVEVNLELDPALFTFEIPAGAEIVTFSDLQPQSLTLEEAGEALLTPAETPTGATLVDILEVRSTLVQRYTLPEGGSFTIAQGMADAEGAMPSSDQAQAVTVRDTTGQAYEDADSGKVLLTWVEGDFVYSVAGDLTLDQALAIAESLQ